MDEFLTIIVLASDCYIFLQCLRTSTPIDYVGILIGWVRNESKKKQSSPDICFVDKVEDIQEKSLMFLDAIFMCFDDVYRELLFKATGSRTFQEEHQ